MPTEYETPGVYVEEISKLPPSVAEVATAVPAFLGYTAIKPKPPVARIKTLLEYELIFGGPEKQSFTVTTYPDKTIEKIERKGDIKFLLYYAISHYFKNGGGPCYVISVGDYSASPVPGDFENGLTNLEKEDEPTLIVMPDALQLDDPTSDPATTNYGSVCQDALIQCNKLGDRFAIFDVQDHKDDTLTNVKDFRDSIGSEPEYLKYGAAYYPYLHTSLSYAYEEKDIKIEGLVIKDDLIWLKNIEATNANNEKVICMRIRYTSTERITPKVKIVKGSDANDIEFSVIGGVLTIRNVENRSAELVINGDESIEPPLTSWASWIQENDPAGFELFIDADENDDGSLLVPHTSNVEEPLDLQSEPVETMAEIKSEETALYNAIKARLAREYVTLPPSAAIAGIYARVDRTRGVWKAPANVGINAVIKPVAKISHEEQAEMNVENGRGRSVNAIRTFNGRGTLVWGARTLDGNSNEWRYISVRRLFNTIEESARKSTAFAVFEPNDMTTWLKVKGMIESYLYGLWEKGALAGPTPAAAYFVNVGLGKTMTAQDILNGKMIVEIGIAAVRPAEFIILRFSHKMQEA